MKQVQEVISLDAGDNPAPNPEQAAAAVETLVFDGKPPEPAPQIPPMVERPKRRTKAELEAENARLAAEIQQERANAAAKAPDLIAAMHQPLKVTFRAAFRVMAGWKGDHWLIAEEECTELAEAWAPCVGPLLATHPEAVLWASAIAATYAVAYPRIQKDKTLALEKGDQSKEEAQP